MLEKFRRQCSTRDLYPDKTHGVPSHPQVYPAMPQSAWGIQSMLNRLPIFSRRKSTLHNVATIQSPFEQLNQR